MLSRETKRTKRAQSLNELCADKLNNLTRDDLVYMISADIWREKGERRSLVDTLLELVQYPKPRAPLQSEVALENRLEREFDKIKRNHRRKKRRGTKSGADDDASEDNDPGNDATAAAAAAAAAAAEKDPRLAYQDARVFHRLLIECSQDVLLQSALMNHDFLLGHPIAEEPAASSSSSMSSEADVGEASKAASQDTTVSSSDSGAAASSTSASVDADENAKSKSDDAKQWKSNRVAALLSLVSPNGHSAADAAEPLSGDDVRTLVDRAALDLQPIQSVLIVALVLFAEKSGGVRVDTLDVCGLVVHDVDTSMAASLLLEHFGLLAQDFIASKGRQGKRSIHAHPLTFLLVHALLCRLHAGSSFGLLKQPAKAIVQRRCLAILTANFYHLGLKRIAPASVGLGHVVNATSQGTTSDFVSRLRDVVVQIAQASWSPSSSSSPAHEGAPAASTAVAAAVNQATLCWAFAVTFFYPTQSSRRQVLFEMLKSPPSENPLLLECLCAQLAQPSLAVVDMDIVRALLSSIADSDRAEIAFPSYPSDSETTIGKLASRDKPGFESAIASGAHDDNTQEVEVQAEMEENIFADLDDEEAMLQQALAMSLSAEPATPPPPPSPEPSTIHFTAGRFQKELLRMMQDHLYQLYGDIGGAGDGPSARVEVKLALQEARCAESIELSNNDRTATQKADKDWGTALAQHPLTKERRIHQWSVSLDRCEKGHVFIGVATQSANTSTYLGGDRNGWGLIGTKVLWHNRSKYRSYGTGFRTGDVITLTLDTEEGTLSYQCSGKSDWGVAFRGLADFCNEGLYPAVALYQRGDAVTLVENATQQADASGTADLIRDVSVGEHFGMMLPLPSMAARMNRVNDRLLRDELALPSTEYMRELVRQPSHVRCGLLEPLIATLILWPQHGISIPIALEIIKIGLSLLADQSSAPAPPRHPRADGKWSFCMHEPLSKTLEVTFKEDPESGALSAADPSGPTISGYRTGRRIDFTHHHESSSSSSTSASSKFHSAGAVSSTYLMRVMPGGRAMVGHYAEKRNPAVSGICFAYLTKSDDSSASPENLQSVPALDSSVWQQILGLLLGKMASIVLRGRSFDALGASDSAGVSALRSAAGTPTPAADDVLGNHDGEDDEDDEDDEEEMDEDAGDTDDADAQDHGSVPHNRSGDESDDNATVGAGASASRSSPSAASEKEIHRLLRSRLLEGGFSSLALDDFLRQQSTRVEEGPALLMLSGHRNVGSVEESTSPKSGDPESPASGAQIECGWGLDDEKDIAFLQAFVLHQDETSSEQGQEYAIDRLDQWMLRFAGKSAFISVGGHAMRAARIATVAAMLMHTGVLQEARLLYAWMQQTDNWTQDKDVDGVQPSRMLTGVWRAAQRIVEWAIRSKQQSGSTYGVLAEGIMTKARFLLSVRPSAVPFLDFPVGMQQQQQQMQQQQQQQQQQAKPVDAEQLGSSSPLGVETDSGAADATKHISLSSLITSSFVDQIVAEQPASVSLIDILDQWKRVAKFVTRKSASFRSHPQALDAVINFIKGGFSVSRLHESMLTASWRATQRAAGLNLFSLFFSKHRTKTISFQHVFGASEITVPPATRQGVLEWIGSAMQDGKTPAILASSSSMISGATRGAIHLSAATRSGVGTGTSPSAGASPNNAGSTSDQVRAPEMSPLDFADSSTTPLSTGGTTSIATGATGESELRKNNSSAPPSTAEGMQSTDTRGCGKELQNTVRASFEHLYSTLAADLERAAMGEDAALQLGIINAWNLVLSFHDHQFLSRIGIFRIFHQVLTSARAAISALDDEAVEGEPNSLRLQAQHRIIKATLIIVHRLASQIVSSRGGVYADDDSTSFSLRSPTASLLNNLKTHTRPVGADTLGKSVFEMLFTELETALESTAEEEYAYQVIMLLFTITVNGIRTCIPFLSSADRVDILLQASRSPSPRVQHRTIRLLARLLPTIRQTSLVKELVANVDPISRLMALVQAAHPETLCCEPGAEAESEALLVSDAVSSYAMRVGRASDTVSLLRTLINDKTSPWVNHVQDTLVGMLGKGSPPRERWAAVCVLGGLFDPLRVCGKVQFSPAWLTRVDENNYEEIKALSQKAAVLAALKGPRHETAQILLHEPAAAAAAVAAAAATVNQGAEAYTAPRLETGVPAGQVKDTIRLMSASLDTELLVPVAEVQVSTELSAPLLSVYKSALQELTAEEPANLPSRHSSPASIKGESEEGVTIKEAKAGASDSKDENEDDGDQAASLDVVSQTNYERSNHAVQHAMLRASVFKSLVALGADQVASSELLEKLLEVATEFTPTSGIRDLAKVESWWRHALLRFNEIREDHALLQKTAESDAGADEAKGPDAGGDKASHSESDDEEEISPELRTMMELGMGFPKEVCQIALERCSNDVEAAIDFCIEHNSDIDVLVEAAERQRRRNLEVAGASSARGSGGGREAAGNQAASTRRAVIVEKLIEMGFPERYCVRAIDAVGENFDNALTWILSHGDELTMQDEDEQEQSGGNEGETNADESKDATESPHGDDAQKDAQQEHAEPLISLPPGTGGLSATSGMDVVAISPDLTVEVKTSANGFPSVCARDVLLRKGLWYYEVTIFTDNCMQIGWADAGFTGNAGDGDGVGDDGHSWSFDGYRQFAWHAKSKPWGRAWAKNQVVCVAVDLDKGDMWFGLDGDYENGMGLMVSGLSEGRDYLRGLTPAVSLNRTEKLQFNFGQKPFKFGPPVESFPEGSWRPVAAAVLDRECNARYYLWHEDAHAPEVAKHFHDHLVEDCLEEEVPAFNARAIKERYFASESSGASVNAAGSQSSHSGSGRSHYRVHGLGSRHGRARTRMNLPDASRASRENTGAKRAGQSSGTPGKLDEDLTEATDLEALSAAPLHEVVADTPKALAKLHDAPLQTVMATILVASRSLVCLYARHSIVMLLERWSCFGTDLQEQFAASLASGPRRSGLFTQLLKLVASDVLPLSQAGLVMQTGAILSSFQVALKTILATTSIVDSLIDAVGAELGRASMRAFGSVQWDDNMALSRVFAEAKRFDLPDLLRNAARVCAARAGGAERIVRGPNAEDMRLSDVVIAELPSVKLALWYTDFLLGATSRDSRIVRSLFAAWTLSLRSPGVSLKRLAVDKLCQMLSEVGGVEAAELVSIVPFDRLRELSRRFLDRDGVTSPVHSRLVQSFVELCTLDDAIELAAQDIASYAIRDADDLIGPRPDSFSGSLLQYPIKFASSEVGGNDRNKASSGDLGADLLALALRSIHIGDLVVRGPAWEGGDEDGGVGSIGFVVGLEDSRIVVRWRPSVVAKDAKTKPSATTTVEDVTDENVGEAEAEGGLAAADSAGDASDHNAQRDSGAQNSPKVSLEGGENVDGDVDENGEVDADDHHDEDEEDDDDDDEEDDDDDDEEEDDDKDEGEEEVEDEDEDEDDGREGDDADGGSLMDDSLLKRYEPVDLVSGEWRVVPLRFDSDENKFARLDLNALQEAEDKAEAEASRKKRAFHVVHSSRSIHDNQATLGERLRLGAQLWLMEDQNAGTLLLPVFHAAVHVEVSRPEKGVLRLVETKLLRGSPCRGWESRFGSAAWRPGTEYVLREDEASRRLTGTFSVRIPEMMVPPEVNDLEARKRDCEELEQIEKDARSSPSSSSESSRSGRGHGGLGGEGGAGGASGVQRVFIQRGEAEQAIAVDISSLEDLGDSDLLEALLRPLMGGGGGGADSADIRRLSRRAAQAFGRQHEASTSSSSQQSGRASGNGARREHRASSAISSTSYSQDSEYTDEANTALEAEYLQPIEVILGGKVSATVQATRLWTVHEVLKSAGVSEGVRGFVVRARQEQQEVEDDLAKSAPTSALVSEFCSSKEQTSVELHVDESSSVLSGDCKDSKDPGAEEGLLEPSESSKASELEPLVVHGTIEVAAHELFRLDADVKGSSMLLSENDELVTLSSFDMESRGLVLGTVGFSGGVHYWEVKIEQASHEYGSVFVGVSERPPGVYPAGTQMAFLRRWDRSPAAYGYVNFRATLETHASQPQGNEQIYGEFYGAGDTVGVCLDMDQGQLSFFMDGIKYGQHTMKDLGIAFGASQIEGKADARADRASALTLYPVIGLRRSRGNKVRILHKHFNVPRRCPDQALRDIQTVSALLRDFWQAGDGAETSLLPGGMLDRAWAHYQRWSQHRLRRYQCRAKGQFVEVDISAAACERASGNHVQLENGRRGLRAGDRVRVLQSCGRDLEASEEACVLGVYNGRIWYRVESQSGGGHEGMEEGASHAWYWDPEELGLLEILHQVPDEEAPEAVAARHSEALPVIDTAEAFAAHLAGWTTQEDGLLVQQVNERCNVLGVDPLNAEPWDFSGVLPHRTSISVVARIALLRLWNCMAKRVLPQVDLEGPLGASLRRYRQLLFTWTKKTFFDQVLAATTTPTPLASDEYDDPPQIRNVNVNRIRAAPPKLVTIDSADKRLQASVFGQLFVEVAKWSSHSLRRAYVGKGHGGQRRAFKVKFLGEGVKDYGGPYRAVFEQAVDELQNDTEWADARNACLLPLLVPSPNRATNSGDLGRDKYCFSPSEKNLKRFVFLGKLVGMAARHGLQMGLDLPSAYWRRLAQLDVGFGALEEVDKVFTNSMRMISKLVAEGPPDDATSLSDVLGVERFLEVSLSDGSIVPVVPGGSKTPLTFENASRYVELAQETRLHEAREQLEAFRAGLSAVVPVEIFALFTESELETLLCGRKELDVGQLKTCTEYEGVSPSDEHVKWFWEVLEEMSSEERTEFLRFSWARSRMPASTADMQSSFKITAPSGKAAEEPDKFLPTSQTCFWQMSLPKYSDKETLRKKLLLAFECSLMDGDFLQRSAEGWL